MNCEIMVSMRALFASVKKISRQTPTETEGHYETYQSAYRVRVAKFQPNAIRVPTYRRTNTSTRSMHLDSYNSRFDVDMRMNVDTEHKQE
jgi:hypothetical protein